MATKQKLREQFKQKRLTLTREEEEILNERLQRQFQLFNWSKFNCIHVFLPIKSYKEPDTIKLISWLRKSFPHIQLVIPKTDVNALTMQHYAWEEDHVFEVNKWGIQEPSSGELVSTEQFDLVIVPLLVFDRLGNRVGFGKGFYDRFLSLCRPDCLKVGLSLFEPVDHIEDTNQMDVPLNYCITPNTIWEFGNP